MRSHLPLLCALVATIASGPALAQDAAEDAPLLGPGAFYRAMRRTDLVLEEARQVESLVIEHDSTTLTLTSGFIVPVMPEEGAAFRWEADEEAELSRPVLGAVYIGEGSFSFTVNGDRTEEEEMVWFLEEEIIEDKAIDTGVSFYFSPERWEAQFAGLPAVEPDRRTRRKLTQMYNQRWTNNVFNPSRRFTMATMTGAEEEPWIGWDVKLEGIQKGRPWLTYYWDPSEIEEVGLARGFAQGFNQGWKWEMISSFHKEEDRALTRRERSYQTDKEVDVRHYDLELEVRRNEDTLDYGIDVTVDVTLAALEDDTRHVSLSLLSVADDGMLGGETDPSRALTVRWVRDSNDQLLHFWHTAGQIHVMLPDTLAAEQEVTLKFRYGGDIITSVRQPQTAVDLDQEQAVANLVNIVAYQLPVGGWFPSNGFDDRFTFDWQITTPKPLIAATSGTLLTQEETRTHWVATIKEERQVSFPIIVLGRFQIIDNSETRGEDTPLIRIYCHQGFSESARSMIPEIEQIISVYSEMFGDFRFPELDIAQMPVGVRFAQAPDGIVRITGEAYLSKTQLANFNIGTEQRDYFLPHELAHHWWGGQVAFLGDRDVWFHETMAEFASALYLFYRDGEEGYMDRYRSWPAAGGDNTTRTAALSVCTRRDTQTYQTSVYRRGPIVMHNLRESLGHEMIIKYMYALAEFGREKAITTEDLQLVLETVTELGPGSFETFFDYYIRGNFDLNRPADDIVQIEASRTEGGAGELTEPTSSGDGS